MKRNLDWTTFGRTEEGIRRDYKDLIKRLEQPATPPVTDPADSNSGSSDAEPRIVTPVVSNSGDFWRININYRNSVYVADLSKSLLDGGSMRTQSKWAKYTEDAKPRGDFYVGDMPIYFSILSAFANAGGQDASDAREFLKKQMREKWLITLTRVRCNPKGKDKVIHNFNTSYIYGVKTNFVGSNAWVKDIDASNLEALLGERDTSKINGVFQKSKINGVFQKIIGTDAYLWRVNSKPNKVDERVAWFNAGSNWANLICDRDPSGSGSSLGVRIVRA